MTVRIAGHTPNCAPSTEAEELLVDLTLPAARTGVEITADLAD